MLVARPATNRKSDRRFIYWIAASLTGSLVLGLALADGRLPAAEAFALSRLDETFQNEAWGRDAEAEARAARLGLELAAIERFLRLARP